MTAQEQETVARRTWDRIQQAWPMRDGFGAVVDWMRAGNVMTVVAEAEEAAYVPLLTAYLRYQHIPFVRVGYIGQYGDACVGVKLACDTMHVWEQVQERFDG